MRIAFDRMLQFYGLKVSYLGILQSPISDLLPNSQIVNRRWPEIADPEAAPSELEKWKWREPNNHNHRRISRMLRSMFILGLLCM